MNIVVFFVVKRDLLLLFFVLICIRDHINPSKHGELMNPLHLCHASDIFI